MSYITTKDGIQIYYKDWGGGPPANPLGLPKSVFDDLQAQLFANRAKFYHDLPAGPFYGFNRPGAKTIEPK